MSESTITPQPLKEPRRLSAQNKAMGEYITEAGVILTTALTNPEVAAKLAARSYDAAKIGAGMALQGGAQAAYNSRQAGLGEREVAVDQQGTMFLEERAEFDGFRALARPIFTDKGDRTTLNLSGSVPQEMSAFVTFTRTAYTNAKLPQFQTDLAPVGFDVAHLDAELAELDTFESLMSNRQDTGGGAISSTGDRNSAFRKLKEWMDRFEGVAKVALGSDLHRLDFAELPHVSVPK